MKKYIQSFMMKVLFISTLMNCISVIAQLEIVYQVSYKPDSTQNVYNVEEMALKIADNNSYFYNQTKYKLDSIYNNVTAEYLKTGLAPTVSTKYELNFGIVKNFENDKFTEIKNIESRNFAYFIAKPYFKWRFLNDTKILHSYTVKKAETKFDGRTWIAWYTEEIPISDGPYKFYGLPGLVLEIADSNKNYNFELIGIKNNLEKLILPKDLIMITEEKYLKLEDKIIKDPAIFVRESVMRSKNISMKDTQGNAMNPDDLYNRIIKEFNLFLKTHNNPIEKGTLWIK